jgi:putative SOS response-associated peptidase YedK
MWGRFVQKAPQEKVSSEFNIKDAPSKTMFEPRYNIAPTQMIAAVRELENTRETASLKWGLIP